MGGRYIIAAALVLVCVGAWSQESEAERTDPIIIVVQDDDAVLIIGDDPEEEKLPDIVFRKSSEYIGEDEDFIIEWGGPAGARDGVSGAFSSLGEYRGVSYRTVPVNIAVISPFELFPFPNKQVVGIMVSGLYGATSSVIGIQAGVVNHVYDRIYGIQAGAVNLSGGVSYGLRVAYLLTTGKRHGGISISGLGQRYTEDGSWGLMIGAYNQAESFAGLQIGAINVSSRLRGVQIGAFNFNKAGRPLPFMLGINVGW